jgi:hypothetical protein
MWVVVMTMVDMPILVLVLVEMDVVANTPPEDILFPESKVKGLLNSARWALALATK